MLVCWRDRRREEKDEEAEDSGSGGKMETGGRWTVEESVEVSVT